MRVDPEKLKEEWAYYVEDLAEIYQDIEVGDHLLWEGKRDCAKRWEAIKPLIKEGSVIFDLGSSTGYFTRRIAREFPTCLVVSMECMEPEATLQRKILEKEQLYNVVLLQHRLTISDLRKWINCVDCIDFLLALSVFHHFPSKVVYDVLHSISRYIPKVVAEVPKKREIEACGEHSIFELHPFFETLKSCWPTAKKLAEIPSHLGNYTRNLYYGEKIVSRGGLRSYWESPNTIKKHTCSYVAGEWKVDGKDSFISGVNAWTLLHFNPIWPPSEWWAKQAETAWKALAETGDYISDCRPWNMLFTSGGLCAIDFSDKFPKGDQAEFHPEDIEKIRQVFLKLKPVSWDSL